MSTAAIRPLFKSVLAMDNDRCAVCNGLYYEILEPENTMVADAMQLSKYMHVKYGAVMGFTLGAYLRVQQRSVADDLCRIDQGTRRWRVSDC